MQQHHDTTTAPKHVSKRYNVRQTFGVMEAPETAEIPGLELGLPNVPPLDIHYVFDVHRLRQLTMFWVGGFRALMIEGDPAAGKTSIVEQWHARLNVPLYKVPCSPTTESFRLIGQMLPTEEGKLRWHDGPVLRACREGTSVLLDEYNTLDPGEATGLNMLLEGYSWTIPETGETITPARTTRFFVTQNAVDSRAAVAGRNVQDVANDDRFSYMEVDYLKPELEEALVVRHLVSGKVDESIAKTIAHVCVDVANRVRSSYRSDTPAIDKPLSTRVVLRWAKYTVMYQAVMKQMGRSGLHYAIRQAVRMSPAMAGAVNEIITTVAGCDENLNR